jgi:hypothetical protein
MPRSIAKEPRELEARHCAGYVRKPVEAGEFDIWLEEQTFKLLAEVDYLADCT